MDKEKDVGWLLPSRVFFTVFRGWIGAAFVSMPHGFMASGYVWATLTLLFLGALSAYCAMLVLRVKYVRVGVHAAFADLAESVMGEHGVAALDAMLLFCQTGFCISYVIFIERNLAEELPRSLSFEVGVAVKLVLVMLVVAVTDPKWLGMVSIVASGLVLGGLVLCWSAFDWSLDAMRELSPVVPAGVPMFVGTACSAMTGIGLVIPFEASLYQQIGTAPTFGSVSFTTRLFVKCLYGAVALSTAILILFGLGGSFTFGQATAGIITLSLAPGPLKTAVQLALVLSMVLAFPLQFLPVRDVCERYLPVALAGPYGWKRHRLRAALVLLICLAAGAIPKFALIYSFVGGFAGCLLAFVVPLGIFMALEKPSGSAWWVHAGLLGASMLMMAVSTVSSGIALFQ